MMEKTTFSIYCQTLQKIHETRGIKSKITRFAECLKSFENNDELYLAAQFIGEGAFEKTTGKRASVGSRTTGLAASAFCEIDYERVFKPCRTATGSYSETIERLMENIPSAVQKRRPAERSLMEVQAIFEQLSHVKTRSEKERILQETWEKMTSLEIKFFIRMLGRGSLRIGFETKSVVSAISEAFGKDREEIRYAHMITGSLGRTAVLASKSQLDEARFRLFHPLSFMLASPIESHTIDCYEEYIAEEKFDGMRAQVHIDGESIKVFSRDLNDVTCSYPEIATFFRIRNMAPAVLDGEICVFKNDTILPFQMLQKRMGIKKPGKAILQKYPVLYISYDLLYGGSKPIFDHSLTERRVLLEELAETYRFPISNQVEIKNIGDVNRLFQRALDHGNEGLILKKKLSPYDYGQRRKLWLKVKKPGGSLDTVIMYAHAGSGKRGGIYSDFTLGISVKNDDRYEEEFIPIGKAYGGYTNDELKRLNERIKKLAAERYGPTLGLYPELVVEIEFDDIQVNNRTKAGYTLRLPRFRSIRWDLGPSDVDTLWDVEEMYRQKLAKKRKVQGLNSSIIFEA